MKIFGYEWNAYVHTKWDSERYDNAYFGPQGVIIGCNPDKVKLTIVESPVYFNPGETNPNYSNSGVKKSYCCGELNGQSMGYGTYKWQVEMPKGKHLWPALWLCGYKSWPPEIDVVEGYTECRKGYVGVSWETKLETNLHRREIRDGKPVDNTHIALGAKGIPTWKYLLYRKEVDEYRVDWMPDGIKIYFNGHLIRTIDDRNMLIDLNVDAQMYPIMNMMVDEKYVHDSKNPPVMTIHNFAYIPA